LEKEESIDLAKLWRIIVARKKVVGGIIIGCTVLAILISLVLPKQWQSTATVQTRGSTGNMEVTTGAAEMMAAAGLGEKASPTQNYIALMQSRSVLQPIIDEVFDDKEEDERPDAETFAKKYLDIKNTKSTNLIEIKAKGRTPEEAQQIAQEVIDNFLDMQTQKNEQTQSLLIKFLNERIAQTKQEAEDASQKFADYQKEHKMYSPDEQAKKTVGKLDKFDEAIKDIKVGRAENQARLAAAQSKLGEIKSSSIAYNINDNGNVQKIRSSIVDEEVNLVGLRQKYTENHPAVIASKERLAKLRQSLTQEVDAAVDSDATSINPTQSEALKDEAQAEAALAVADATEAAVNERRAEVEDHLSDFPQEVIEYMQLQRDADIKNEIYVGLVKQCENDKLKEAMEAMDIQIIDEPNLPYENHPSFPKKGLFTLVGMLVGMMISLLYVVWYGRRISG